MYALKKTGKVFTSKFVVNGPSSYKKIICRAAVSQRLRNTVLNDLHLHPPLVFISMKNIAPNLINQMSLSSL